MSAKALPFLVLPLAVMMIAILLNSGASPNVSGAGLAQFCAAPSQQNCAPSGSLGTSYFCQPANILQTLSACEILPSCNAPPYPAPVFCVGDLIQAAGAGCFFQFILSGSAGCGVYLPANVAVFIPSGQIAASLSSGAAFFSFTASGASGFISIIGVSVGLISLAGLTVFGSGEQGEGLHILFMGGMVLGLWLVLAGIEGYVGGSPSELFFSSFNAAITGSGTFFFVVLTLSTVIGFVGLVSRGS